MGDPYSGIYSGPSRPTPPFLRVAPAHLLLAAVCGVALWLGWLGWDHEASWDAIAGVEQYPYTSAQVAGCAASIAVVAAVLGAWRQPLAAALGLTGGFVLAWSIDAASVDDTGLWPVGALLLTIGMGLGTMLCAAVGWGISHAVAAVGRRRASGK